MEPDSGASKSSSSRASKVPSLDLSAIGLSLDSASSTKTAVGAKDPSILGIDESTLGSGDVLEEEDKEGIDASAPVTQGIDPHSISCVIMAVTRTLLSTGVLAAIQAGAASMPASLRGAGTSAGAKASAVATGAAVSAAHLHHLSFRAVIYHWELIVRTIRARQTRRNSMKARQNVTVSHEIRDIPIDAIKVGLEERSESTGSENKVRISVGPYGRRLLANRDIAVGEVLLREKPYAIRPVAPCQCNFESVLMAEHIDLAWEMARQEVLGRTGLETRNILSSGTVGNIPVNEATNSDDIKTPFVTNQWPLQIMVFMAVVSCICSVYDSINASSKSKIDEVTIEHKAFVMFEILTRLPQNCHGIHTISSTETTDSPSSGTFELSQRRLAIGVFLRASASNHSCDPSCCTRFDLQQVKNGNFIDSILEIVALKSIPAGEECTISYGVVAGSHDYESRQSMLRKQYLFQCNCVACKYSRNNASATTAAGSNASIDRQMGKYLVAMRLIQTRIDNLKKASNLLYARQCEEIDTMFRAVGFDSPSTAFEGMREAMMGFVKLRCEYLDVCALRLVNESNYSKALKHVEAAIDLMLKHGLYTESDSPIGRERVKLAQLYHALGNYSKAKDQAQRAATCLLPYTTIDDPDMNTLRKIVEDCELYK